MALERDAATAGVHTVGERLINFIMSGPKEIAGGFGISTAISAIMSQIEYRFKKGDVTDLYKRELAAQLGKSEKSIKVKDLEKVATGNRTMQEQLSKAKKERNIGIGTIFIATLASVAIAGAIMSPFVLAGTVVAGSLTEFFVTTALAVLAYMAVKAPLQRFGEKLFGVDKKTTHERIEEISKEHDAGKVISRERVFSVFVHANDALDQAIKENYGKEFDKLKVSQKMRIADEVGGQLGVAQMTDDINQGRVRATELAFTVEGKISGVESTLGDEPKSGIVGKVKEKLHNAAEILTGHHPADDKPEGFSHAKNVLERRAVQTQLQR